VPEVTVLMPVYNAERYVADAVESILAQTHRDFELLVIDDGSTDASAEVVRRFRDGRVRLERNDANRGLTATLNHGLRLARAELIARQDADDISLPDRLERQVRLLRSNEDVALAGARGWVMDDHGHRGAPLDRALEHDTIRWELLFDNGFIHTSVLFRKSAVLDLGGFDESFAYCQDYELWSRLARSHRVANLADRLVGSRFHPGAMTATMLERNAEENRRIVPRNLEGLGVGFSREDVELIVRFREGLDAGSLGPFLALFDRLLYAFREAHPAAAASRDFQWTVARQFGSLIFGKRHRSAGVVMRSLAAGIRRYPVVTWCLSTLWDTARSKAQPADFWRRPT
jgi:glycosyltransferase involved in cell wall biosynthesis